MLLVVIAGIFELRVDETRNDGQSHQLRVRMHCGVTGQSAKAAETAAGRALAPVDATCCLISRLDFMICMICDMICDMGGKITQRSSGRASLVFEAQDLPDLWFLCRSARGDRTNPHTMQT